MKKQLLIAILLTLTACSGPHYTVTKDGVSDDQRKQDAQACFHEANLATSGQGNVLIANSMRKHLTLECMQGKGYTVTEDK